MAAYLVLLEEVHDVDRYRNEAETFAASPRA